MVLVRTSLDFKTVGFEDIKIFNTTEYMLSIVAKMIEN
jgi:hypothetical protein